MKKVEHSLEFIFDIYWWTRKINNYLKNCWSGLIKKIILIFTTLHFLKKIKKNTCRYHYQNSNLNKKKWKKLSGDILLYIHVYHKWRSYDIWLLKYKVQQTEIVVILGHFLPFQTPDNLEKKNFKFKKIPGDIIILHICTINKNHLMYGSWDIEHNRENFLSFWTGFCPFTSLCT